MKMDDSQLVRAIEALETAADDGDLAEQRATALEYYRGDNVYPAPEGRSQVIDRSVYDTAEAVKGPVLKLFLSGDEVVKFTPRGPEDIQAADQESAYINYIVTEKNSAFDLFSGWLHDGFIQKNGYVKAYWHEVEEPQKERYQGLTPDEYKLITSDPDAEVVEEEQDEYGGVNVTIQRIRKYGCVKTVNLPPESMRVDPTHTKVSLADCKFVRTATEMTISELRDMGFDVDDDISDSGSNADRDYEAEQRRQMTWQQERDGLEPDPSMRRVTVREVWMRVDVDGDGYAELRHLIVVGTTVLLNEEETCIPVVAFSPKPLPHQHHGESFYDELKEVQDVKTALLRGVLDNLYLANNGRWAVNSDRVNLDDLLVSRPGGIVRVEGEPAGSVMPMVQPSNPGPALSALEYMDVVRETRTGVTRVGTGLDPNALNKTASGIAMLQGAQSQRIELIARHFAESVKELCLLVHGLTLKHSRQQELVMLRNEWVPIDPRQWTQRKDMSISVGLGNGNRQEQSMFLMQWLQFAAQVGIPSGLVTQDNFFTAASRFINTGGFKNAEEFVTNPAKAPPKPPQPNPEMLKLQQQGQIEAAKLQKDAQTEQMRLQAEAQLEQQRLAMEKYKADLDAQIKVYIEQLKAGLAEQSQQAQIAAEDRRAQPMNEPAAPAVDSQSEATRAILEGMMQMMQQSQATQAETMRMLATSATGRKQVIRDASGRVVEVGPVQQGDQQ